MTSKSELRKIIKHITFMKMASNLSKLSYDPKHQVGSLLIKNDWTEINSMGYNGNYQGAPNKRDSLEIGKSNFIHAEMNALILSTLNREEASKYTLYVTMTPCEICSRLIVNKGIKNVIALNKYENCGDSLSVFKESDINFNYIKNLIGEFYTETYLFPIVLSKINQYFNYKSPIDNIDLLDNDLIDCFKHQMGEFFEYNDNYLNFIPNTILKDKDDFTKYNIEAIIRCYIKIFSDILYELV